LIERATKADQVKGVVLAIDSPGGTTAGGEAIYEAVRKLAEKKPVVAQVGTLAASAGYMIACATDHIVARQSSIVGSIGVLVQIPNVKGLLDKIGVEVDTIKSAPLKAEPSPFNETTEAEREMMRAMIMDSFNWFEGIVIERRPLSAEEVRALADGSVFTGRQALQRKLIDELGGPDRARDWLTGKGLDSGLKVVEWKKPQDGALGGFPLSLAGLRDWVSGRDGAEERLLRRIVGDGVFLDGLLSLWQPSPLVPERSE
ncbi:MAG: signal peptide peptidase SppA, partial [Notoacmeibacter sp.]|nr:signal peptide peptidase SppA [Notoacmeibacter sp.]